MNSVSLIGNLTFKPELKKTQSGKSVVNITVAVNRGKEQVDFINCVAWEKVAENMANYLDKGSKVAVDGFLQSRNYDDKDGKTVYVLEVVARNVQFLSTPKQKDCFDSDFVIKEPKFDNTSDITVPDDMPF